MTEAASNLPSEPGPVGDWEELGRSVFSRSHKRKAYNTGVPLEVFLEKDQVKDISVDRLTLAPVEVAVANSSKAGSTARYTQKFLRLGSGEHRTGSSGGLHRERFPVMLQ